MPTYVVACVNCGEMEVTVPMREAAEYMPCPLCRRPRPQRFHVPQFQEDRTGQWKGPLGNGWSTALGEYMPDSRSKRDKIAQKKGVEFCSLAELRADNKEAAAALDYHASVQAGGPREAVRPAPDAPWQPKPAWAKELT